MQALFFAHTLECAAFEKKKLSITFPFPLYEWEGGILVITGEGILPALSAASATLAKFPQIQSLINLGVAGALRPKAPDHHPLVLNSLHRVSTVYAENPQGLHWHSYSSPYEQGLSCFSSHRRLMGADQKAPYRTLASVVDRELYGLAWAAHSFHVPWWSYKVISDTSDSATVCDLIQSQGEQYSTLLYDFFLQFPPLSSSPVAQEITLPPGFFASTTQKRQWKKLSEAWQSHGRDSGEWQFLISDLLAQDLAPKERTKRFVNRVEEILYPQMLELKKERESFFSQFANQKLRIHPDPSWEGAGFDVYAKIQTAEDLKNLGKFTYDFPFGDYSKFISGEGP